MNKKPHSPFLLPAIFFVMGLAAVPLLPPVPQYICLPLYGAVFFLAAVSFFAVRYPRCHSAVILLIFFLLGSARYVSGLSPRSDDIGSLCAKGGSEAFIIGRMTGFASVEEFYGKENFRFTMDARKAVIGETAEIVSGKVKVRATGLMGPPLPGDIFAVSGKLSRSKTQGDRSSVILLSRTGDICEKLSEGKGPLIGMFRKASGIRKSVMKKFKTILSPRTAEVAAAVTLGAKQGMSDRDLESFSKTGTMHVFAVSGLHVGIAAMGVYSLLSILRAGRFFSGMLTAGLAFFYAILTGASPSAMRAACMLALFLAAGGSAAKSGTLNALSLSALVISFLSPGYLFMKGFALSFAAVLSLVFLTPVFRDFFRVPVRGRPGRILRPLTGLLTASTAVWAGTLPLSASFFGLITTSSLLANLAAVPWLSMMVGASFLLVITSLFSETFFITRMIALFLEKISSGFVSLIGKLGAVPFAAVRVPPLDASLVVLYYAVLALLVKYAGGRRVRIRTLLFFMFIPALFVMNEAVMPRIERCEITFFDVGNADSALIRGPGGFTMLVDGGRGAYGDWDHGRAKIAPRLWKKGIRCLDCIVLSHPHEDHIGGLFYILENFRVRTVFTAENTGVEGLEEPLFRRFTEELLKRKITHVVAGKGDIIKWRGNLEMRVYGPPLDFCGTTNDRSLIFKLVSPSGASAFFPGDAGNEVMDELALFGAELKTAMIKVPHHGSRGEGSLPLMSYRSLNAGTAVVPAKERERVSKYLLDMLVSLGCEVFITGETGDITFAEKEGAWHLLSPVEGNDQY